MSTNLTATKPTALGTRPATKSNDSDRGYFPLGQSMLREVHGDETALWMRRWRWFLLATAGLFGFDDGSEWGVSHYRLKAAA